MITRSNERPGADAGWRVLFAFGCPRPPHRSGRALGEAMSMGTRFTAYYMSAGIVSMIQISVCGAVGRARPSLPERYRTSSGG
jgi:hypothetical protein